MQFASTGANRRGQNALRRAFCDSPLEATKVPGPAGQVMVALRRPQTKPGRRNTEALPLGQSAPAIPFLRPARASLAERRRRKTSPAKFCSRVIAQSRRIRAPSSGGQGVRRSRRVVRAPHARSPWLHVPSTARRPFPSATWPFRSDDPLQRCQFNEILYAMEAQKISQVRLCAISGQVPAYREPRPTLANF